MPEILLLDADFDSFPFFSLGVYHWRSFITFYLHLYAGALIVDLKDDESSAVHWGKLFINSAARNQTLK